MLKRSVCIGIAIIVTAGIAENACAFKMNRAERPGYIIGFGQDDNGKSSRPPDGNDFVAISAGKASNIALRADGSVVIWGGDVGEYRDTVYTAVAAGAGKLLALRADHSIAQLIGTGTVPAGNDFVQISSGGTRACALRSNGTIVQWDVDDVPAPNEDFVAVECGNYMAYGLKSDGTVIGWGSDALDERAHLNGCGNDPNNNRCALDPWFIPANWTVATNPTVHIAAGRYLYMFIRADGSLATGGRPGTGAGYPTGCTGEIPNCYMWPWWQWPVDISLPLNTDPHTNPLSTGWIQVAPGGHHNLALRRVNGRNEIVLWGEGLPGYVDATSTVPLPGYGGRPPLAWNEEPMAVASGFYHSLAIIHRYPTGDINNDDEVDFKDLALFAPHWANNNITPGLGLIDWWKFDEPSGATAADSSGNDHTAALAGSGAKFKPDEGRFAGSVWFDGIVANSKTARVEIAEAGMSNAAGTISFWTKLAEPQHRADGRNGTAYFFSEQNGSTQNSRLNLKMSNSDTKLDAEIGSVAANDIAVLSTAVWYQIAVTWDSGSYNIYLNGNLIASGTATMAAFGSSAAIGNRPSYINSFDGLIDDFRIYNRALDAGNIADTYAGKSPGEIYICAGLPEGDLNSDCKVDFADLVLITDNWLK